MLCCGISHVLFLKVGSNNILSALGGPDIGASL